MAVVGPGTSHEPAGAVRSERRKGLMERVIEAIAGGLGNSVAWMAETGILFAVFALIWAAFTAGLLWSQGSIDQAWVAIRDLPFVVQLIVWILFLPVMVGLWIWETTWPLLVRLALILSIAGWNLLVFLPRALQAPRP
jgi:ABC-type amino acid transport system permease subunit